MQASPPNRPPCGLLLTRSDFGYLAPTDPFASGALRSCRGFAGDGNCLSVELLKRIILRGPFPHLLLLHKRGREYLIRWQVFEKGNVF